MIEHDRAIQTMEMKMSITGSPGGSAIVTLYSTYINIFSGP